MILILLEGFILTTLFLFRGPIKHFSSIDSALTHLCVCNVHVQDHILRILYSNGEFAVQVDNKYVREKIALI